jgi:hypothetical protein
MHDLHMQSGALPLLAGELAAIIALEEARVAPIASVKQPIDS